MFACSCVHSWQTACSTTHYSVVCGVGRAAPAAPRPDPELFRAPNPGNPTLELESTEQAQQLVSPRTRGFAASDQFLGWNLLNRLKNWSPRTSRFTMMMVMVMVMMMLTPQTHTIAVLPLLTLRMLPLQGLQSKGQFVVL